MKKKALVISPHPDDETLGVGGSIAKLINQGHDVHILTISGHLPPLYKREDYDKKLDIILQNNKVDYVLLSGFMRILSEFFCNKW